MYQRSRYILIFTLLLVTILGPLPTSSVAVETYLPVYKADRHQVTKEDGKNLAAKFGMSGEPRRVGYEAPGYYAFIWENSSIYFQVSGGSGTGSYEYYLKGPGLTGTAPSAEEAGRIAKEFLLQKDLIDNSYIISGILTNVSDISIRSNLREDHKQVYFRKTIEEYQVYDWIIGSGSPIVDRIEVWVGVNGRIIYASHPGFWTTINFSDKTDYLLKEPSTLHEDLKAGKGKIAWIGNYPVNIPSGEYGPMAPTSNFAVHGFARDIEIESVALSYYHEPKDINNSEYYQPVYLFKTQATLDWKDDYTPSLAEETLRGNRTTVTILIPATEIITTLTTTPAPILTTTTTPTSTLLPPPTSTPAITTTPTPRFPDATGDNRADQQDLQKLIEQFGKAESNLSTDFNGDHTVSILDYEILRKNYNTSKP